MIDISKKECNETDNKIIPYKFEDTYFINKVKNYMFAFSNSDTHNENYQWPLSIEHSCWWCAHKFNNIPCGIPVKYSNEKYYLDGIFCSFNCSLSYLTTFYYSTKLWERHSLLASLYHTLTGNDFKNVKPAPHFSVLKKFGGPYSIEEYRKDFSSPRKEINLVMPPMISLVYQIEEKHTSVRKPTYKNSNKENKNSKGSEDLVLYRTKPLVQHENSLLQSLEFE